jgi:cell division protein FtsX
MRVLIKEVIMAYVVYIHDTIKNTDNETVSAIAQQWSGIKHDTYAEAEAELAVAQAQWPDATIEEVSFSL